MIYMIPWSNEPRSNRSVILEGQVYLFYTYWNYNDLSYYFDMTLTNEGSAIYGVKMVTGLDLFGQLALPQLGNLILLDTVGWTTDDEDCTKLGLGNRWKMFYASL